MAYNPYFPQFFPTQSNLYPTQQYVTPTQPTQNGITWVQGEASAKSYPVSAGQSVLLMDSEESVMYIKSTDQSGMPLPLRIFDYTERTQSGTAQGHTGDKSGTSDYVLRDEFETFKADIAKSINGMKGEG